MEGTWRGEGDERRELGGDCVPWLGGCRGDPNDGVEMVVVAEVWYDDAGELEEGGLGGGARFHCARVSADTLHTGWTGDWANSVYTNDE